MSKAIQDLKIDQKVVLKDVAYGAGVLVGLETKGNKHLVAYKDGDMKFKDTWTNSSGKFLEGYPYSDSIKEFKHFYYVDGTMELHNNDTNGSLNASDKVDVYFDANGKLTSEEQATQTKVATVVGFNESGAPLLYLDSGELGAVYVNTHNRHIHEMFDDKLDKNRLAFVYGTSGDNYKRVKKGKVKKMDKKSEKIGERPGFLEMAKADAKEAAYRVASKQMVTGMKAAILKVMEQKGQGSDRIKALSDLLETQFGEALVGGLLGVGLTYAPMISEDPRAAKLADEFRVGSMATVGNAAFETIFQHLMPMVNNALASLPAETAVRVAEPVKKEEVVAEEEQQETKEETKKQLTV